MFANNLYAFPSNELSGAKGLEIGSRIKSPANRKLLQLLKAS